MQQEISKSPRLPNQLRALIELPISLGRDFVLADLRAGFIRLRGLNSPTQLLVVIGFGLVFGMVGALLFNGTWRAQFALVPQLNGAVGRGSLVPDALIPVTFFFITVAWTYMLAGALHTHWLVRVAANAMYLLFAWGWLNLTGIVTQFFIPAGIEQQDLIQFSAIVVSMLTVPIFFVLRSKAHPEAREGIQRRPAMEWLVLFICVGAFFAVIHARDMASWHRFGIPVIVGVLQTNLVSYQGFVAPLLLLAGVNIALFTNQAARWTTEVIQVRLAAPFLYAALVVAFALRIATVLTEANARVIENGWQAELFALGGALGVWLLVGAAYWVVVRLGKKNPEELNDEKLLESAHGYAIWLILAFSLIKFVEYLLVNLAQALPTLRAFDPARAILFDALNVMQTRGETPWLLIAALLFLAAGIFFARRGAREIALYVTIAGALTFWYEWLAPNGWLAQLHGATSERIDFLAMLFLLGITLYWTARRRLTVTRAAGMLFLIVLFGLLRQTNFISSPFSPFLGFAGIGFVAFGILYDAIGVGKWANASSPNFPRVSRIFLYLGYVLLSVMIVNWALASHDLKNIEQLTGSVAWHGMEVFGIPLLYAIAAITVTRLFQRERWTEEVEQGASERKRD